MHGCEMAFIKDQKNDASFIYDKTRVFWFVSDDSTLDSTWFLITVSCEYFTTRFVFVQPSKRMLQGILKYDRPLVKEYF